MDAPAGNSVPASQDRRPKRRLYSAPRRFDLATVFVVTTAYALLMGGLSSLGAHPALTASIAVYVTLVGIGQALLFGGTKPRRASLLVGATINAVLVSVPMFADPRSFLLPDAWLMFGAVLLQGAVLGYFAGVLVGGVFLVADPLRHRQ